MADNAVQIPPLRTNLNDPEATDQTAKEWYLYWQKSGQRINTLNGMISYGDHADRLNPSLAPDGALFVDSDYSGIVYQNQGGKWHYTAGTMWGTLNPDQRPVGLGANDAGFTFRAIDTDQNYAAREFVWSGSIWVETTPARYGTHAARLGFTNPENGELFVEYDRNGVIYQNQFGAWHFLAGIMWGTLSPDQRPTDLGANDAGFTFRGSDQAREYIWSGTVWVEIGDIVENQGAALPVRGVLNFTGAGVTASDDTVNLRTNITISGAGTGGGAVTSVFGRTGAVTAQAGDYSATMVNNAVDQTGSYANPAWISSLAWSKISGAPATGVSSVFTRTGAVVAATGDYTAAQITNAVDSTQTYANPAWLTSLAWGKVTGAPAFLTSLTPWTSNINGAGYSLSNVPSITTTAGITFYTTNSNPALALGADGTNALGLCQIIASPLAYPNMDQGRINFYSSSGNGYQRFFDFCAGGSNAGGNIRFLVQPASGATSLAMFLNANGLVGIGLVPSSYQLQLSTDSAAKPSTNTWTIASGAAVKQRVKDLEGGLSVINQLRPTEAEYNGQSGTPKGRRVVSVIAEEVRKVLPHTVTEDSEGNLGFNVHEVIFHLILAVQQLSRQLGKT